MKTALLSGLFLFSMTFWACECKPDEPTQTPDDFSCLKLYDEQGQDMGIHGCATTNDWTNQTLSADELNYFAQNDTATLAGTESCNITGIALYPVPVVQSSFFSITLLSPDSGKKVKLQLAFIDEDHNVLNSFSTQIDCHGTINLMVPADKFKRGEFYRVYYRISAENSAVLYEGHGNIAVCKEPGIFDIDTGCI